MRKLIDFYTFQLVKQNFIYFLSFVVLILLAVFVLPPQIKDFTSFKEKNKTLTQEVADLERKRAIVASVDTDEIEDLIVTLNTLLPQREDYFSIFSVLENLSQLTDFRITGFSLSLNASGQSADVANKLALQVTTDGSPEAFSTFLESYQYKGGRLITMESVNYSPETLQTSLTLNFYSQKIEVKDVEEPLRIDKSRLELIKKINDELNTILPESSDEEPIDTNYPTSENPFSAF